MSAVPTTDRGRVVVVAAGFALWSGGRCVAAARWGDIRRLRAYHRGAPASDALCVSVDFTDGSVMELHEDAPGFDAFLDRASAMLQGLLPYRTWHPTLSSTTANEGVVIFERAVGR